MQNNYGIWQVLLNASVMGTYHFLPVRSSSSSFIHPLASVPLKLYHLNYICKDSILMRFQGKLSRSMKRGQMSVCSQVFTKFQQTSYIYLYLVRVDP